jgi:hypothetical protein
MNDERFYRIEDSVLEIHTYCIIKFHIRIDIGGGIRYERKYTNV